MFVGGSKIRNGKRDGEKITKKPNITYKCVKLASRSLSPQGHFMQPLGLSFYTPILYILYVIRWGQSVKYTGFDGNVIICYSIFVSKKTY